MEGLLQRVTDLVKAVMPGRSEASVTLLVQERPSTVVAAGRLAVDLDEDQYERGHGPCLHVAATRETAEIRAAAIGPSLPRTVDRRSRRSPGRSCPPVIGGGSERGWNGTTGSGFQCRCVVRRTVTPSPGWTMSTWSQSWRATHNPMPPRDRSPPCAGP